MTEVASYLDVMAPELLAQFQEPRRALFLDRDGVVNVDRGYVHTTDRVIWIDGILELCRQANAAGYLVIVVTNQAGIARGYYSQDKFAALTEWIHAHFRDGGAPLLATYYCPHHPTAGVGPFLRVCECRKPRPGMILKAAADFDLQLGESLLLGDSESDLRAAEAAGVGHSRLFLGGQVPSLDELLD